MSHSPVLQFLRHRVQGQEGFTLIELLVVILIIGILAAIAIPTFLAQTNKANDANVMAAINTAHTTELSYRTSNSQFAQSTSLASNSAAAAALTTIEPSLTAPVSSYGMTFAQYPSPGGSATSGYTISATDTKDNVVYALTYNALTGAISKTCALLGGGSAGNVGACSASGTWGG